jgi:hypothetical protein
VRRRPVQAPPIIILPATPLSGGPLAGSRPRGATSARVLPREALVAEKMRPKKDPSSAPPVRAKTTIPGVGGVVVRKSAEEAEAVPSQEDVFTSQDDSIDEVMRDFATFQVVVPKRVASAPVPTNDSEDTSAPVLLTRGPVPGSSATEGRHIVPRSKRWALLVTVTCALFVMVVTLALLLIRQSSDHEAKEGTRAPSATPTHPASPPSADPPRTNATAPVIVSGPTPQMSTPGSDAPGPPTAARPAASPSPPLPPRNARPFATDDARLRQPPPLTSSTARPPPPSKQIQEEPL